jgi:hypothetical protein
VTKSKPLSRDAWTQALHEIGVDLTNDQDALTVTDLGVIWGCSRQSAKGRVLKLLKAGRATATKKLNATNHIITTAYRLTKR